MSSFTNPTDVRINHRARTVTLLHDLTYIYTKKDGDLNNGVSYTAPKGFTSDMATIPCFLRTFWGKLGPHNKAAIIHDFLYVYTEHKVTRREADKIFYQAMGIAGTKKWSAWLMFVAVRVFGVFYYKKR